MCSLYLSLSTNCYNLAFFTYVGRHTSYKAIRKLEYSGNDPHMLQHPNIPHVNAFQLFNIGFHPMPNIKHERITYIPKVLQPPNLYQLEQDLQLTISTILNILSKLIVED